MVPEISRMPSDTIRSYLRLHLHVPDALDTDGINKTKYVKIPYYYNSAADGKTYVYYHKEKAKAFVFKAKAFLDEKEYAYVHKRVEELATPAAPTQPAPKSPQEPTLL